MATPNKYFTYERRDIDRSTINWAGIGNEISTNIKKIEDEREAQRQELQEGYLETIDKLQNYEQGLNTGINEFMTRSSNNSKQYIHEKYKMMKNGLLDPSDFNLAKIKLSDTYKILNDTAKTFNEKYETAIEEGSEGSLFLAEEGVSLFDFKNRELVVNPETSESYLARVNADGKIDENSIKPVRALANNQNFIWEGFNPEEEISDKLDGLGVWKIKLSDGSMTSSAIENPDYEGWENSTIKSFTTRDRKAGSILTEGVGGYSYTRDKEEAKSDPNKILMKDNADGVPMPELTEEQETRAEDYLRNQIRAKIGFTEEEAPQVEESETDGGDGDSDISVRAIDRGEGKPPEKSITKGGEYLSGVLKNQPEAEILSVTYDGGQFIADTRLTEKVTTNEGGALELDKSGKRVKGTQTKRTKRVLLPIEVTRLAEKAGLKNKEELRLMISGNNSRQQGL